MLDRVRCILIFSVAVVLLAACTSAIATPSIVPLPSQSSTPTTVPIPVSASIVKALKDTESKINGLWEYSVLGKLAVLYADGQEKDLRYRWVLKFNDPEEGIERSGSTGLAMMSKSTRGVVDSLAMTLLMTPGQGTPRLSAQALSNRQPGRWILLGSAIRNLASAPAIVKVDEGGVPDLVGVEAVHYRAVFPSWPDLKAYGSPLMLGIYENASVTVDFWIGKYNHMIRRMDVITKGISYPEWMPEPNDLAGAVEERVTLTFHRFNNIDLSQFGYEDLREFDFSSGYPIDLGGRLDLESWE